MSGWGHVQSGIPALPGVVSRGGSGIPRCGRGFTPIGHNAASFISVAIRVPIATVLAAQRRVGQELTMKAVDL